MKNKYKKPSIEKRDSTMKEIEKIEKKERLAYRQFVKSIVEQEPLDRAHSWLTYVSENRHGFGDLEAVVYLRSRGEECRDSVEKILEEWRQDSAKGLESAAKCFADKKRRSVAEIYQVVGVSEYDLPDFWGGFDDQELSIDATMYRVVEWCNIVGFERWWKRNAATHLRDTLQGGLLSLHASFFLFYMCRSDYAIELMKEALLPCFQLCKTGIVDSSVPWRHRNWKSDEFSISDHVGHAAILVFSDYIFGEHGLPRADRAMIDDAIDEIIAWQHGDGGWSFWVEEQDSSIEATCIAIHALAVLQPSGWVNIAKRAKDWLLKQQKKDGSWSDRYSEDSVFLTVVVMDSLELAEGGMMTTFLHKKQWGERDSASYKDIEKQEWYNPRNHNAIPASLDEIKQKFDVDLLFVVATDVELKQVLRVLRPLQGQRKIRQIADAHETYYLGRFVHHNSAIVKCGMGSGGIISSSQTTRSGIELWGPKAVIMVGIAFGRDRSCHGPADVLVAKEIIPYENQRVGASIMYREPVHPTGRILYNRFENIGEWIFNRPDGSRVQVHYGSLLSGEKLIDNASFKEKLMKDHPSAIGGEMEGAGVFASAEREGTEWIVIKSVCDWADGKKHDGYQEMAAAAAVSLVKKVLGDPGCLRGL